MRIICYRGSVSTCWCACFHLFPPVGMSYLCNATPRCHGSIAMPSAARNQGGPSPDKIYLTPLLPQTNFPTPPRPARSGIKSGPYLHHRDRVLVAMRVEPRPPSKLGNKGKRRWGFHWRAREKKGGPGCRRMNAGCRQLRKKSSICAAHPKALRLPGPCLLLCCRFGPLSWGWTS